jgi:copper oxidase (laccase) domain-containing protein
MKKMFFRMAALMVAMMMTMTTNAASGDDNNEVEEDEEWLDADTLAIDTTLWYNQTQQLGGIVVKGRLPKTRVKGDAMRTTVAGTILEKAGTVSDALSKIP